MEENKIVAAEVIDPEIAELNLINGATEKNRLAEETRRAAAAERAEKSRKVQANKWYGKFAIQTLGLSLGFNLSYKAFCAGWIRPEVFIILALISSFLLGVLFGANWNHFFGGERR